MRTSDTLLVGFDFSHGDIPVLIVGRKDYGEKVDVINQFQGEKALQLYSELLGEKAND